MINCGGTGDLALVKAELVKQMAKQLHLSPIFTSELPDLSQPIFKEPENV
jgi:hypothetical protein